MNSLPSSPAILRSSAKRVSGVIPPFGSQKLDLVKFFTRSYRVSFTAELDVFEHVEPTHGCKPFSSPLCSRFPDSRFGIDLRSLRHSRLERGWRDGRNALRSSMGCISVASVKNVAPSFPLSSRAPRIAVCAKIRACNDVSLWAGFCEKNQAPVNVPDRPVAKPLFPIFVGCAEFDLEFEQGIAFTTPKSATSDSAGHFLREHSFATNSCGRIRVCPPTPRGSSRKPVAAWSRFSGIAASLRSSTCHSIRSRSWLRMMRNASG